MVHSHMPGTVPYPEPDNAFHIIFRCFCNNAKTDY